jgi:hypothetical protein
MVKLCTCGHKKGEHHTVTTQCHIPYGEKGFCYGDHCLCDWFSQCKNGIECVKLWGYCEQCSPRFDPMWGKLDN